jgi:hypothetical protein
MPQKPSSHLKKLKLFFFSGTAGSPVMDLVIFRIAREISVSSSVSGVAVLCILRTAA